MRARKRTSNIAKWSLDDLQAALKAIKEGKPVTHASAIYGIPRTTIARRLKHNKFSAPKMGRKSVFTAEQEKILTNHIIKLQRTCPLNSQKVRKLAFILAEKLHLDHNFNREKQEAGQDWLSYFLKRNPRAQILRLRSRIQETKDVITENPNLFNNLDEDLLTSEAAFEVKNEEILIKMETDFSEDSNTLDFHSAPLDIKFEDFESNSSRCLKNTENIAENEKEVTGKFGMKLRVRKKSRFEEMTSSLSTHFYKQPTIGDRSFFLEQLEKSNQVLIEAKDDVSGIKKRARKPTSSTAKWSSDDLQAALKAMKEGKPMSHASALYGVPRTTIYRRLKHNKFSAPKMGRKSVFTTEQEEILTSHIIKLQRTCPLNSQKVRKLAFNLAEKLHLDHNFNREKQEAGQDWLSYFLKRNPRAQILRRRSRIQETKDVNTENPNLFNNLDEDLFTSETAVEIKNEEILTNMPTEFLDDSETLDFHSDPLDIKSDNFGREISRCLEISENIKETEKEFNEKFDTKFRLREKLHFEETASTLRTHLHKETKIVDRRTFLNQLEKSNQVVIEEEDDVSAFKTCGKRSTKTASWTAKDLNAALQELAQGKTMTAVSALHGVPRTSIYRRLKQKNFSSPKLGRHSVFTPKQEEFLTDYILKVSKFCPMNTTQLRRMAFELAEKLNLDHSFNRRIRLAGKDWLTGFIKRNPRVNFKGKRKLCEANNYQDDKKILFYDFDDLVKSFPSLECQSVDV